MNKRQLEVQKLSAEDEVKLLKELKVIYAQAQDECVNKIIDLSRRKDMQNLQSIIYQKQYQEALKKQIDSVLDGLHSDSFNSISDYIINAYENGFFGTLYDLQGQGVPLLFPINQEQVLSAIQINSKISNSLYSKMGEDITDMKKAIRSELSRGIVNGESYFDIASHIAKGMNSPFKKAYNSSLRIARTEGHRVQQEATLHCQQKAKEKGADVVKQWDSTLDGVTRPTHKELDGQIREIDEPFEVSGKKAMYPGGFGTPSEDCNCRCCLLQRARWALSDEEYLKMDGDKNELVKIQSKSYNEFKDTSKHILLAKSLQFLASDDSNDKINTFLKSLTSGEINTSLRWNKQREHIDGTKENATRIVNDLKNGKTPASIFYESVDIEKLFEEYSGKGDIIFKQNQLYPIEYIDTTNIIGKVYNLGSKEYIETKRIGIQYSSKGYHIYPVKGR